jgi:hypothetical protein
MLLVSLKKEIFKMNRREAISRVALIMGGALIGEGYLLNGCKPAGKNINASFDQAQLKLLDNIGNTILPATHTPGAKDVQIGNFMALMVKDCYVADDQQIFMNGITKLNDECRKKYSEDFLKCTREQQTELLNVLDKEQNAYTKAKKPDDPNHYFRMMKELTILGYFTSEAGCSQALRYLPVPGKFDGCIPYKKGDKAWAIV